MNGSKEDRAVRALDYFHQGYNCSQSVFAAFADVCGLTEETALKLSSPRGSGHRTHAGSMRRFFAD